jgi:hypothetical protein
MTCPVAVPYMPWGDALIIQLVMYPSCAPMAGIQVPKSWPTPDEFVELVLLSLFQGLLSRSHRQRNARRQDSNGWAGRGQSSTGQDHDVRWEVDSRVELGRRGEPGTAVE